MTIILHPRIEDLEPVREEPVVDGGDLGDSNNTVIIDIDIDIYIDIDTINNNNNNIIIIIIIISSSFIISINNIVFVNIL